MPTNEWTHHDRTVRISVDMHTSRPPGRGRAWTAETGHTSRPHWRGEGATEKAASDALAAGLALFVHWYRPPVVLSFRGHAAVVSVDLDCAGRLMWRQDWTGPNGCSGGSAGGAKDWDDAEAQARNDLAHRTTDWHDDASVHAAAEYVTGWNRFDQKRADALYEYAAWQRAAKHAIDQGMGDDFHPWAGEHWREFALTRPEPSDKEPRP